MIAKSKRKTVIYMDQDTSKCWAADKSQNWYYHNFSKKLGTKCTVDNSKLNKSHLTKKDYTTGRDITDV